MICLLSVSVGMNGDDDDQRPSHNGACIGNAAVNFRQAAGAGRVLVKPYRRAHRATGGIHHGGRDRTLTCSMLD